MSDNSSILYSFIRDYGVYVLCILLSIIIARIWNNSGLIKIKRDLSNQIIVITGSNSGIGLETAKDCVKNGARVILACREEKNSTEALAVLNSIRQNSTEFIKIDLCDNSSIYEFVKSFKSKYPKLDILINNAGVMAIPKRILTKDGYECHIGTNHFGHFLLTNLLLDSLKASNQFRIINVSSVAHVAGVIDFEDLHYSKRYYDGMMAYSQSKLANILFTIGLQKRINEQNLNGISVCLHPGIVRTDLFRNLAGIYKIFFSLVSPLFHIIYKSPLYGAQTSLYCVHEDFSKLTKGAYYSDCKVSKTYNKYVTEENSEKLWNISLKSVKL